MRRLFLSQGSACDKDGHAKAGEQAKDKFLLRYEMLKIAGNPL